MRLAIIAVTINTPLAYLTAPERMQAFAKVLQDALGDQTMVVYHQLEGDLDNLRESLQKVKGSSSPQKLR